MYIYTLMCWIGLALLLLKLFRVVWQVNCKVADFGTAKNVRDVDELHHHTANLGTPM